MIFKSTGLMKTLIVIIFGLLNVLPLKAQQKVKTFPEPPKSLPAAMFFDNESFAMNEDSRAFSEEAFELYVSDEIDQMKLFLDSVAAGWKAQNVSHLEIKWNLAPEAKDSAKQEVIQRVIRQLPRLTELQKVSKLKTISFFVGEGLFLKEADSLEYYEKSGRDVNLQRAYSVLHDEIAKFPLHLRIYSTIWGW
jgi:hypothetical protein